MSIEMTREYHPAANLFPLLNGDDYEQLKADIEANGLLESIWLTKDGAILDGRNRHRACIDLGIEPRFRTYQGDSPVSFVVSLNLTRRHLTASQKAMLAVDVLPMLEEEARERMLATQNNNAAAAKEIFPEQVGQARDQAGAMFDVSGRYVSDAKKLAETEPELAEQVRAGELTIPQAKSKTKRKERVDHVNAIAEANAPLVGVGPFPVIYADPPWEYEHTKTDNRRIDNHYPTMALADICDLPVADITTPDAVLFLWATSPKLEEALQVMRAWGFTYRTSMVWVKPQIGMGYYARQQHELLLIGARGSLPVPEPENRPNSALTSPRTEHSRKPEDYYRIIETMYPEYSRVELFARNRREGWHVWGNQS